MSETTDKKNAEPVVLKFCDDQCATSYRIECVGLRDVTNDDGHCAYCGEFLG